MSKKNQSAQPTKPLKLATTVNYTNYVLLAIFLICLIIGFNYTFVGINNYLLENHAFRQTQTALTSYYFVKDGYKLAYETPVVGAPWSIPFEFPLYQAVCSYIKSHSSMSLDKIGRLVSLFFYVLCLVMTFFITKRFTKNKYESLFLLAFILLHPIYLFWSRTFMIESTALFFCLFYLYFALNYIEKNSYLGATLALLGGVLAGLVKITTLIPFFILLFTYIIYRWYKLDNRSFEFKTIIKNVLYGIILFAIPLFVYQAWSVYTEHLRCMNDYAKDFISTKNLSDWFFGTMDQKTSTDTWSGIFKQSQLQNGTFYFVIAILAVAISYFKFSYWKEVLICLALYLITPFIFTNLHFVHDYYTYSNSIFLSVAVGFAVLSLVKHANIIYTIVGLVIAVGVLTFFSGRYKENYLKVQKSHPDFLISTCNLVKENTKPDDVIMVYGNDWGGEYAYYTERRTIALRNTFKSVKDSSFVKLMRAHEKFNVNTLVFVSYTGLFDKDFANELINTMGFQPLLQKEPFYVFKKPDIKK